MIVTLNELKLYLRIDNEEEDVLLLQLRDTAEKVCLDMLRTDDGTAQPIPNMKVAVLYTAAYFYEHREEADYTQLMLTLRSLLSGSRREVF